MNGTAIAQRSATRLQWPIVAYFGAVHAGALLLCPLFPSATALWLAAVLYVVTGFGITVGYHRLLTHTSFACARWLERGWAILALLAGEGPPLFWVMSHRKHHRFSDRPGDPHSPAASFAWAHWLWLFPRHQRAELGKDYARYAPHLTRQRFYRALEMHYLWLQLGFGLVVLAAGWAVGGAYMGWSFLGYAYFLRMVLVLHATWLVNSLSHKAGAAPYRTGDASRNNWLVAVVALGEGWHNNHHHFQASANHGHHWWELDPSFLAVLAMAGLSQPLAWIGRAAWRPVSGVKVYRGGRLEVWFA